jgi:hypothetical protein
VEWLLLAIPILGLIALFGPSRYRRLMPLEPADLEDWSPPEAAAGVREPRRPVPEAGGEATAVDPYDQQAA